MALDRQDWWDLGFTAALCTLPVLAWTSTFHGAHWWWAGLLGVATGIGVTAWVIASGGGPGRILAATIAAYLLLCGPLAYGGFGGRMVVDGLVGTLEGWPMLVAAHPWVDSPGAGLLPVLQMTLLGSVAVTMVAVGSRSPAAPVLPAAVLFAGAVFTARSEPATGLAYALVFGVLAVAWARQRSRLVEGVPLAGDSLAGHATALIPAIIVLAVGATLAGLVAGAVDVGSRTVLRGLVPAYDVSGLTTPLDRFSAYRRQAQDVAGNVHGRPLLAVTGAPEGTRIRFVTLDTYDGERWLPANDTDPMRADDRYLRIASRIDNPATGEIVRLDIVPRKDWSGPWVATTGGMDSLEFGPGTGDDGVRSHLRYNPATRTAVMTEGHALGANAGYTLTGRVHDPEFTADVVPSDNLDEELYERAAFLDPAVEAWSAGASTPAAAVLQIAASLKQAGHYASDAEALDPGHGEERLGAGFVLAQPTIGNEAHYAAAMALMANRLRVPARVVVGAEIPASGVVRGQDVTPWVELRAADGTWHLLDADEFTSSRRAAGQGLEGAGGGNGPEKRIFVERPPQEVNPPESEPPTEPPEPDQEPDAQDHERSDVDEDPAGRDTSEWLWYLLAGLGLALVAGVVPGLKRLRRWRRLNGPRAADRYVGAWTELVDSARDLGHRVPTGLTRPAEADHLERHRLATLAEEVDIKVFGAPEPDSAEAAEFWRLVHGELSELRSQASRTRRVWAMFNPKSFLR